jgi:uncharacterized surface protein with fasciclin (FAS1) repeats
MYRYSTEGSMLDSRFAPKVLLALGLPLVFAACDDDDSPTTVEEPGTILEVASDVGTFNTLTTAIEVAGLESALSGPGPFTVFAPSDAAFGVLPEGTVEGLLANPEALANVLTYHVVAGELSAADVAAATHLVTLNGQLLDVVVDGGQVFVDGVQVATADVEASNGVIHVLEEGVLLPESRNIVELAVDQPALSTLVTAVEAAGLGGTLGGDGPFTVFAPLDEAFGNLPEGALASLLDDQAALTQVLTYHVVPGRLTASEVVSAASLTTVNGETLDVTVQNDGTVLVGDARIVAVNVDAANGVVHLIDRVLMPGS